MFSENLDTSRKENSKALDQSNTTGEVEHLRQAAAILLEDNIFLIGQWNML